MSYSPPYASIAVADPRRPSAVLGFSTAARVYRPGVAAAGVLLNLSTTTYLGDAVKGAATVLAWSLPNGRKGERPIVLQKGALTYAFKLPRWASKGLKPGGGELLLKLTWLDATRDLLTKTLSLPVEDSAWHIGAALDPPAPFAGFPFLCTATLTLPAGKGPGSAPKIKIFLQPRDEGKGEGAAAAKALPPSEVESQTVEVAARTRRDDGGGTTVYKQQLRLTLPKLGRYNVIAEVTDNHGAKINATIAAGRTQQEAALAPLMGLKQTFGHLTTDAPSYQLGDTVSLQWYNTLPPQSQTRALLIWGNSGAILGSWLLRP